MTAAANDITIEQGEDWTPLWQLKWASGNPYDLTGYTAHMEIRSSYSASAVLVELSSTAGSIVLGGANGTIQLNIGSAQSMALLPVNAPSPTPINRAVNKRPVTHVGDYDLRLISPAGKNWPIVGGKVFVVPNITR